jgi:hypothetical protein
MSALVVAWAAFAPGTAVAVSADQVGSRSGSQCEVMDNLTEKTVKFEIRQGAPEQVGSTASYWDEIYSPDGTKIGTVAAWTMLVERRPSDGHLMQLYLEEIRLPRGTLVAFAYSDRTAALGGSWVTLFMLGTGGDYVGKAGIRTWQLLSIPDLTVRLKMTICPHNAIENLF